MRYELFLGNCLGVLKGVPDNSVDSIVTDPPYGLAFMGKKWDYDVPEQAIWEECLRVMKPGGHLLSFAGTRTQHRMAVRIEDAGFEIRDMIAWVYGSGFPKSMDVSKAIDKAADVRDLSKKRITAPATDADAALQWQGWGTALKPALEPITVARKPFKGTVAANVLEWGTGAINIDGARVQTDDNLNGGAYSDTERKNQFFKALDAGAGEYVQPSGRWPANLIHDGSEEVLAGFPANVGANGGSGVFNQHAWMRDETPQNIERSKGSAARFFYCAKTSRKDRGEANTHPTVKPTDLMAYLCRLVTPPGGTVLDPFMGSGSTGKAAMREGFRFIGIEMDAEYLAIAEARIAHEAKKFPVDDFSDLI